MQKKCESVNIQRVANTSRFNKRIGSTVYKVYVHFNEEGKETLSEKTLRLMKNDLQVSQKNTTMEPLQAGWLPERGSL